MERGESWRGLRGERGGGKGETLGCSDKKTERKREREGFNERELERTAEKAVRISRILRQTSPATVTPVSFLPAPNPGFLPWKGELRKGGCLLHVDCFQARGDAGGVVRGRLSVMSLRELKLGKRGEGIPVLSLVKRFLSESGGAEQEGGE